MNGVLLSAVFGYLLGSIPFGFLVAKSRGIDIRKHGSGNIGATNVFRTLGKTLGYLVFALDAVKGLLAVRIAESSLFLNAHILPAGGRQWSAAELGIIAAIGCIMGHNFPVWLGFKGGKGVATSSGVVLGLVPVAAIIAILTWLIVFYSTRYVSVGSIAAGIVIPIVVAVEEHLHGRPLGALFWFSVLVAVMAVWRHKPNIQRLLAGTESRFEKKK